MSLILILIPNAEENLYIITKCSIRAIGYGEFTFYSYTSRSQRGGNGIISLARE